MTVIERRRTSPWTDVLGWLDEADIFGRFPSPQLRVEDFVEDNTYVIRADVPGIDPERDQQTCAQYGLPRDGSPAERVRHRPPPGLFHHAAPRGASRAGPFGSLRPGTLVRVSDPPLSDPLPNRR
jgi:hypothetical protein